MILERFEMIDRVEAVDLSVPSLRATALVPKESPVFEGHFPGHPIVPGVLLLETMAQAAGYLLIHLNGLSKMVYLASAKEANFRSFVAPETPLIVEASREHDGSGYAVMKSRVLVGAKKVADAQMFFRFGPFPNAEIEAYVHYRANKLGFPKDAA